MEKSQSFKRQTKLVKGVEIKKHNFCSPLISSMSLDYPQSNFVFTPESSAMRISGWVLPTDLNTSVEIILSYGSEITSFRCEQSRADVLKKKLGILDPSEAQSKIGFGVSIKINPKLETPIKIHISVEGFVLEWVTIIPKDFLYDKNKGKRQVIYEGSELSAIYDRCDSDILVISFSGYEPPDAIRRPYGDSFLQSENFSVIFVVAKKNNWYQTEEFLILMSIISEFKENYKRCITYGQSMGGYGAILAASRLGIYCLATAPQTVISDPKNVSMMSNWMSCIRERPIVHDDIRETIHNSAQVNVIIDLKERTDREHFNQIAECEKVLVYKIPYGSHLIPSALHQMGILKIVISAALKGNLEPFELRKLTRKNRAKSIIYISTICNKAIKRRSSFITKLLISAFEKSCKSESINIELSRHIGFEIEKLKSSLGK
ncbi:hypothetical protein [Pseudomonas alabamensis]|uniref:hypothetical protein n=1 Tax=Pseudomonas alabamensis TaxID=3064349 RepID=UPI0021DA40B4|nr:hypothetical protein [Pseudomonas entomophila]